MASAPACRVAEEGPDAPGVGVRVDGQHAARRVERPQGVQPRSSTRPSCIAAVRIQMRHTFGSLLINVGEPVTYVSRQLGHKDSAITLKVYARWLPDETRRRGVDRLDDDATIRNPRATCAENSAIGEMAVSDLAGKW